MGRSNLKTENLKRLFIWPAGRNVELWILAENHDRAAEGAPVVDDDIPVAENILEGIDINMDGIVLEDILKRLESGTNVFVILG